MIIAISIIGAVSVVASLLTITIVANGRSSDGWDILFSIGSCCFVIALFVLALVK